MAAARLLIEAEGRPLDGIEIASAEVFQAADRPDRIEASIAAPAGRRSRLDEVLGPGAPLRAVLDGEVLFEGQVARAGRSFARDRGAMLTVVGYAAYHRLRSASAEERYFQATDGEIAERIASSLELSSAVETQGRIHASITRRGDPLRFLRGLAREGGFQLAVSRGRLYFLREPPEDGGPLRIDAAAGIASWKEAEGEAGRLGRAVLAGDPRLRPLAAIEGAPPGRPTRPWRIHRAIHGLGPGGYTTEVELLARCFGNGGE
jgi:hypothetical protein